MRYLLLLLVFSVIAIHQTDAQRIKGEGEIVKKELNVSGFDGVRLGFSGDVYLTQGTSHKVVVEGQQNIIDNIKTDVKGGVWNINFRDNVKDHKRVKVYITMPKLSEVGVSGSGNMVTESRFTGSDHVKVYVSGSGDVMADLEANSISGAISGSGKIRLKGSSGNLDMSISGSGDIMAMDHKTGECEIAISGSGDAEVWATETLDASISGSGDIKYKGDAAKVRARVSGSGDVTEVR